MTNLKEKYADLLSPIRQAGNSLTLRQNFPFKHSKALVHCASHSMDAQQISQTGSIPTEP